MRHYAVLLVPIQGAIDSLYCALRTVKPTFHLEIVCLSNVQQVVPVSDLEGVFVAVLVDEGHLPPVHNSLNQLQGSLHLLMFYRLLLETHSSPGFGVWRWPCCRADEVENSRVEATGWKIDVFLASAWALHVLGNWYAGRAGVEGFGAV